MQDPMTVTESNAFAKLIHQALHCKSSKTHYHLKEQGTPPRDNIFNKYFDGFGGDVVSSLTETPNEFLEIGVHELKNQVKHRLSFLVLTLSYIHQPVKIMLHSGNEVPNMHTANDNRES